MFYFIYQITDILIKLSHFNNALCEETPSSSIVLTFSFQLSIYQGKTTAYSLFTHREYLLLNILS